MGLVTRLSGRIGGAAGSITVGKAMSFEEKCVGHSWGANRFPFGDQEYVGDDAERRVMRKAAPTWPLGVAKSEFLLAVLVIPLDSPTQLGGVDQGAAVDGRGQCGEEVLRRLGFTLWPFGSRKRPRWWQKSPARCVGVGRRVQPRPVQWI